MDIGEEKEKITVEPLVSPVPVPDEEPDEHEVAQPEREPANTQ